MMRGASNAVSLWIRAGLDLLWPRTCLGCAAPMSETECGVVCPVCETRVPFIKAPFCYQCGLPFDGEVTDVFVCGYCRDLRFCFERTVCACRAEGLVRDFLHRFKYQRQMYVGPHLADWMIQAARQWIDWNSVDAIVPVPLHPRKKRERQFNQTEYLSAALGRAVSVPVIKGNLRRVKDTASQTRLDARERAANMRDAFAVRQPEQWEGKRIVLLDDVFTTGATMNSCARLLTQTGTTRVTALALARGI